jgi:hypothetical protein
MNFGDSVQDVSRPGTKDATRPGGAAGSASGRGDGHPSRSPGLPPRAMTSPGAQRPVQDIQDIIDKLNAVTQQLRRPGVRS